MRITQTLLLAITLLALSCTAQKKYELVLSIQDDAPTVGQLDSTIAVIKKRLQPFDKGNDTITVSTDKKSITLQTACNEDFIHNGLLKKGKLDFFECLTLENIELTEALQNTDKAMSDAIAQGITVVQGVSNTVFQKDNPLFRLMLPQQPFNRSNGTAYYTAHIATVMDSMIPLLEKCLPLLYERLPDCKVYFKKVDDAKMKISEMYLLKTGMSTFDASRYVVSAVADKDYTNHPVVTMEFDKVGTLLWAKMTTKNTGKYIAIVVDNKLLSVPMVNAPITGGSTQIAGVFTSDEVKQLAATLSSGYLPLSLQIASINVAKKQ